MKTILTLFVTLAVTQSQTPKQVADELLAADRAYSAASAKTDLITGISAMFAADVTMTAPGGLISGADKAIETLRSNQANAGAKAVWTPARVAISRDGYHGFTAGYMTITRADGSTNPAKYLAYWQKQNGKWRVLAYKRNVAKTPAPEQPVTYVLPENIRASMIVPERVERDRESLSEAERSFAKDAQTMGLGNAFKKYGSTEAINLGGPDAATFVFGNEAIGNMVGQGQPPNGSAVNWGPEKAIVAISGDFGVTIGYIHRNADPNAPGQPFFTIWRREGDPLTWHYIAE